MNSVSRLFREIRSDYRRYRATGAPNGFIVIFLTQGFWASCVYRVARWARLQVRVPIVRKLARKFMTILGKMIEIVAGVSLPPDAEIGEGLYLAHFGPTVVNPEVRMGRNCCLSQGVTVGVAGRGERRGARPWATAS